ncbi:MAG: hypothetical protein IKP58_17935 [Victivallales bacterium]|nr:hypothetical protein [Victivallales bacterium]
MKKQIIATIAITAALLITGNLSAQQRTNYVTPRGPVTTQPTRTQLPPSRFVTPDRNPNHGYRPAPQPPCRPPVVRPIQPPKLPTPIPPVVPQPHDGGSHVKPAPVPQPSPVRPGAGYKPGTPSGTRFVYVR